MSALHALDVLSAYSELRRNCRAVVLDGPSVTTLSTPAAPSVIERAEPETRASVLAALVVHFERRGDEWQERGRDDLAGVFFDRAREVRGQLRAVVRSEGRS